MSVRLILTLILCLPAAGCSWFDNLDENKVNGQSLYNNNCARCHGFDANGGTQVGTDQAPAIVGRLPQDISNAILTFPEMAFLQLSPTETIFTAEQLQALSDYLLDLLLINSVYLPETIPGQVAVAETDNLGDIQVRDRDGHQAQLRSDATGGFDLPAQGLRPPLILQWTGDLDGRRFYGRAETAGQRITISPVSDLVLRGTLRDDELQMLFLSCLDTISCDELFLAAGQDLAPATWRLGQRLQASALVLDPSLWSSTDPALLDLGLQLEAQRLVGCGNPYNHHGHRFDPDRDGDCYLDGDLDFDGFDDEDLDRDGVPDQVSGPG